MQPNNPIVGGTVLRRPAIQSPNYVAGSTGWAIVVDGSAEFNNLTARGTFIVGTVPGTHIVLDPATGNLVMYDSSNNIRIVMSPPDIDLAPAPIHGLSYNLFPAKITTNTNDGTGTAAGVAGYITIISPLDDTQAGPQAFVQIQSRSHDGTTTKSVIILSADTAELTGTTRADGGIVAQDPNSAGNNETWHAFPYSNSWADAGGTSMGLKYRLTATGTVHIHGTAHSPNPFNSVLGTLGAAYRPASTIGVFAWTGEGNGQLVSIASSGVVTAFGSTTVARDWWINGEYRLTA